MIDNLAKVVEFSSSDPQSTLSERLGNCRRVDLKINFNYTNKVDTYGDLQKDVSRKFDLKRIRAKDLPQTLSRFDFQLILFCKCSITLPGYEVSMSEFG